MALVVVFRVVEALGAQDEPGAEKDFRQVEASQWSLVLPHCIELDGTGQGKLERDDIPIRTESSSCCPCKRHCRTEVRSAPGQSERKRPQRGKG